MPEWNCEVCNSGEHYPMMIILCGHSFCEDCLQKIDTCPVCRVKFTFADCQPNYAVAQENHTFRVFNPGQPHRRTSAEIHQQLEDLIRKRKIQIDQIIHRILGEIIKQLDNQLTIHPELPEYTITVDKINEHIITILNKRLFIYHLIVSAVDDGEADPKATRIKVRFDNISDQSRNNKILDYMYGLVGSTPTLYYTTGLTTNSNHTM